MDYLLEFMSLVNYLFQNIQWIIVELIFTNVIKYIDQTTHSDTLNVSVCNCTIYSSIRIDLLCTVEIKLFLFINHSDLSFQNSINFKIILINPHFTFIIYVHVCVHATKEIVSKILYMRDHCVVTIFQISIAI